MSSFSLSSMSQALSKNEGAVAGNVGLKLAAIEPELEVVRALKQWRVPV
jgi:hypothetical protein